MDRLPPHHYVEEGSPRVDAAQSNRPQREQHHHRPSQQQQQQSNNSRNVSHGYPGAMASASPPPQAALTPRERLERSLPAPPPLPSHASSTSASSSTKYSPSDLQPGSEATSIIYPSRSTDTNANLLRDKEGNVYHPQVTFADSTDRPSAYPTLSYGNGGAGAGAGAGPGAYQNNHPGAMQHHHQTGSRPGFGATASSSSVAVPQHEGGFSGADFRRKKSLVRPERERFNPDSRNLNYRQHAAAAELEGTGRVGISRTGYHPGLETVGIPYGSGGGGISAVGLAPGVDGRPGIRRGKSILAREEDMANESGLSFLKRGATLRRNKQKRESQQMGITPEEALRAKKQGRMQNQQQQPIEKAPLGPWMIYCYIVTFFMPGFLLKSFGGWRTFTWQGDALALNKLTGVFCLFITM